MRTLYNRLFHPEKAATVPSMDGALRPNTALDTARVLASLPAPDNLLPFGKDLLFSSGAEVWRLTAGSAAGAAPALFRRFEAAVTAMAASPGGTLAVGIAGTGVRILGADGRDSVLDPIGGRLAPGPTALAFLGEDRLALAIGSARNGPGDWQRDLMERQASGSVWTLHLAGAAAVCHAEGLAWPNGLLPRGADGLVVSESWNHRLLTLDLAQGRARPTIALEDLPGYAGRLSPGRNGGAWLAVFAPRSQLIEFVLRERAYCTRMLSEVPRDCWIAPTLRSGRSFREPMQGGAVRVHGIFKPWAPTRSYGLAVELDRDLLPVRSFHSRADGNRHGIVSLCEWQGEAVFASAGDDLLGALPLPPDASPEAAR